MEIGSERISKRLIALGVVGSLIGDCAAGRAASGGEDKRDKDRYPLGKGRQAESQERQGKIGARERTRTGRKRRVRRADLNRA